MAEAVEARGGSLDSHHTALSRSQELIDLEKQKSSDDSEREEAQKDPNLVEWNGPDDPELPMNWSRRKKWTITMLLGFLTFTVTFSSSVFSTAVVQTAEEFDVSEEVMVLGTALFVLGFAFGPMAWAPLSELFGRRYALLIPFGIFIVFQIPVAVAQNLETVMICRFLCGFFGSAPTVIVGGQLADLFEPVERGVSIVIFAGAVFIGPTMGPIIGGFITMSYLRWRWTAWITMIMAGFVWILCLVIVPETSAPVLLQRRAKRIRYETRNWAIHAKADEKEVNFKELRNTYLLRPLQMLALEPILVLITIYLGFVYGVVYLFFEAFPITFQLERGWNEGIGALPFLGILVGVVLGSTTITIMTLTRFKRITVESNQVIPEERLLPMIIGGALFPIGLFWFAWTSNPVMSPAAQIVATVPIGMGVLMIFLQGLSYLIDVYKYNAASSFAANSLFRSALGAGFPMFATAMYMNLGVPWATSLLGFVAIALFPVPILFYIYGARIRKLSRFSPD